MAPTYSRGISADDGTKQAFCSTGTSLSLKNGSSSATMANRAKLDVNVECPLPKELLYGKNGKRKIILLSRHGESENNLNGKIGGDTNLSSRGRAYATALASYVNSLVFPNPVEVWTSGLKRTIETAAGVKCNRRQAMKELNELHAGCCEGMSYEEIQLKYPSEFAMRDQNKLTYKYPNGESYEDVMARVAPVIDKVRNEEKENDENVILIVSHQAVLRCVLSKFLDIAEKEVPYIQVPLHTVIWLIHDDESGEWRVSYVKLPVECVDTFRPKPTNCNVKRSETEALETVPTHY